MEIEHPFTQLRYIHPRQLSNILASKTEVQCHLVQAVAVTLGTHHTREKLPSPLLRFRRGILALLHLYILHQTIIREEIVTGAHRLILDIESLVGAIHNVIDSLFGQITQWRVERSPIFLTNSLYLPEDERIFIFPERRDATVAN